MNAKKPRVVDFTFCYRPVRRAGRDPSAKLGPRLMVVATITNLENDGVKADLAGDTAFLPESSG